MKNWYHTTNPIFGTSCCRPYERYTSEEASRIVFDSDCGDRCIPLLEVCRTDNPERDAAVARLAASAPALKAMLREVLDADLESYPHEGGLTIEQCERAEELLS